MQTTKIGRVCQQSHHMRGDDISISGPKKSSAKAVTGKYEPEPTMGLAGCAEPVVGFQAGLCFLPRPSHNLHYTKLHSYQFAQCTYMPKPEYYSGGWFSIQSGRLRAQNINKVLMQPNF